MNIYHIHLTDQVNQTKVGLPAADERVPKDMGKEGSMDMCLDDQYRSLQRTIYIQVHQSGQPQPGITSGNGIGDDGRYTGYGDGSTFNDEPQTPTEYPGLHIT